MMKKGIVLVFLIFTACSSLNQESNHYFIKGLNHYQKNDKNLALKNYIKAYELNKKDIKIIREIAYIYGDLGDYSSAKEYYKKALEVDIYDQNSLGNLLKIYYSERDIENLEKYIGKILDKNSFFYKENFLKLAILKGDYDLAFLYLENIVEFNKYEISNREELYKNYLEIKKNISKEHSERMLKITEKLYEFYQDKEDFFKNYFEELKENKQDQKVVDILLEKAMSNEKDEKFYLNLLAEFYLDRKEIKKYRDIIKIMKNKN